MKTSKTTNKKVSKSAKESAKRNAERYGYTTDVDTKNKKGKTYAQKPVKNADAKKDAKRKALPAGKRTTVWGTTYTETRVNRSDKKS
jgi:hypothetical protein